MLRIGATSHMDMTVGDMKREFLFFDEIAVHNCSNFDTIIEVGSPRIFPWRTLLEEDLIRVVDFDVEFLKPLVEAHPVKERFSRIFESEGGIESEKNEGMEIVIRDLLDKQSLANDCVRQMVAAQVSRDLGDSATCIPVIPSSEIDNTHSSDISPTSSYLSVVLNSFPAPSKEVSWEQIIEMRKDEELTAKRKRLFSWQNKMIREGFDSRMISDEIATYLHDYEQHMRKHRLDIEGTKIECVIRVAADFVDDVVHMRIAKAAEKAISFRSRKLRLMVTDENAPCREVAYIADLHQRLK